MKCTRVCGLVVCSILLMGVDGQHASGQLDKWLTSVQVSVGGNGLPLQFNFDGGINQASSFTTLVTSGASPRASSQLAADGYIPTLKIKADAHNTRNQAVAWGVQGYTNTSGSPLDTSLVLNLTANITGTNDLDAHVYLFQDEDFEFAINPGTILFESSSQLWPGFEPYANNLDPNGFDISIPNHTGPVNETRQFDFTVPAGDSFYVWARLLGTADTPGVVDAYSTLTASLTNIEGLEPAVVPEPGTLLLLLIAVTGVCLTRRATASLVSQTFSK